LIPQGAMQEDKMDPDFMKQYMWHSVAKFKGVFAVLYLYIA